MQVIPRPFQRSDSPQRGQAFVSPIPKYIRLAGWKERKFICEHNFFPVGGSREVEHVQGRTSHEGCQGGGLPDRLKARPSQGEFSREELGGG
jgi:hypothetical protein